MKTSTFPVFKDLVGYQGRHVKQLKYGGISMNDRRRVLGVWQIKPGLFAMIITFQRN